ncbi:MAG: CoA transferase [Frankiales bacterium]|nr:CoA transferase [Frankiales bacterium]
MTATANAKPGTATADPNLPLAGIRIIDLTMVWAGPFATKHLVDLGAEVIKIEGPGRLDLVRTLTVPDPEVDEPYNNSRYFNEYNRNKLGMAIDMQKPAGQQIVRRLAETSDVLIENFRPGVIDRLGLSYDELHKINPRIIVVSLPGYSNIMPERGIPGYGPNVEQMGGLAHFNGYQDGTPQKSGVSYGDPIAGLGGAAAVLMALVQRERTGVGQYIEASQRNMLIGLVGDGVVAHQFGNEPHRIGNRSRIIAPQGVYPCAGDDGASADEADSWVAVSIVSDEQWVSLCQTIDRKDLIESGRYADVVARRAAHDEIDEIISGWTRERSSRAAADALQSVGIPSSPVLTPTGIRDDPQLGSRDFFRPVQHPELGEMSITAPTWHFHGVSRELEAAPRLGEHNRYVLTSLLDYTDDEVDELESSGIVASRPR